MLQSLLISQTLLWVVIIALSVVCLALARQIGVIYERIAPAGALAMNKRLAGGDRAPVLSVATLAGDTVEIGKESSKRPMSQLLFFLSPSCPICRTLLPVVKAIRRREHDHVRFILASDGDDPDTHRKYVQKHGLQEFDYVLSESLGLTYGVGKLPYAVLIDPRGIVSALGIVNTREHLESLFEAQALGRATLQDYLHDHHEAGNEHGNRTRHEPA